MVYNEKWERTKRYLFRNLLEDPCYRLSPVTEESVSDDLVARPYSPLPDLVIEPEPNRHDEPPEFYQGLEVRMRRLYKRLLEDRESSEESEGLLNIDEDIDVDQHISNQEVQSNCPMPAEFSPERNILKEIQNLSKSIETKGDKSAHDDSPIISFGKTKSVENRTTAMEFTESNFYISHSASTTSDTSGEVKKIGMKTNISEPKNEQSGSQCRSSPIISYGRTILDAETRSNETELTELDMDLTNIVSTTENEPKEKFNSKSLENSPTDNFGRKTFSVDKDTETELTESDADDTHIISTIVAEIHEEPCSGKTAVFETESPVLVPRLRTVSNVERLSGNTGNDISSVDKTGDRNKADAEDDVEKINENNEQEISESQLDDEVDKIFQNSEANSKDQMCEGDMDSEKTEASSKNEDLFALLKGPYSNTEGESATEDTIGSNKSNQGRKRPRNSDEYDINNSFELAIRKGAFERVNKRKTFDQSSEEIESETEENDSKENNQQTPMEHDDDSDKDKDSFEMAMRQEVFQRVNRRKGFGQTSEELHGVSEDEEVEPVEEMRGAPLVEPLQAFRRKSTASQESLLGTFAKTPEVEIQEDVSIGDEDLLISCRDSKTQESRRISEESMTIKSPVHDEATAQSPQEFQKDTVTSDARKTDFLRGETSLPEESSIQKTGFTVQKHKVVQFQDDISVEEEPTTSTGTLKRSEAESSVQKQYTGQKSPEFYSMSRNEPTKSFSVDVKESSVSTEETTPFAPRNNVTSTLCDLIWSVSPIPINTADFSPITPNTEVSNENVPAKRRQKSSSNVRNKRKKYQNKVVQTSCEANSWESVKSDFFVGTPHIFRLCSCDDHTCCK